MKSSLLKKLEGDDIFISYSRGDGAAYLTGLDAALSRKGFACFTDKRGTDAGRLPPKTLYRKIRNCNTLVLLASPRAQMRPENITQELKEFVEENGTSRIICVSFDRDVEPLPDFPEVWQDYIVGKAREREDPAQLKTGEPSESVVNSVVTASDYMKSKDRLRNYRNRVLVVLAGLVLLSAAAGVLAWYQLRNAKAALRQAGEATIKADAETARAAKASEDARIALTQARDAQEAARKAKDEATKQKGIADKATQTANEAARRAREETARADAEQKRAEREGTIAEARSLANQSQAILRLRPADLDGGLKYAADSVKKFSEIGVHSIEADMALRESLALFPRLRSSHVLPKNSYQIPHSDGLPPENTVALSPDGRHFALIASNGKPSIYESSGGKLIKELDTYSGAVALSNGPDYAAVVDSYRVRIIDVKSGASRELSLPPGSVDIIQNRLALSPGGRYLALTRPGAYYGKPGDLMVVEVSTGKVVKSFRPAEAPAPKGASGALQQVQPTETTPGVCGDLNLQINDVAFGPKGNLVVGGRSMKAQDGGNSGRVVLWPLPPKSPDGVTDPELTAAYFENPTITQQEEEVRAVAPGADITYFATNSGIWRRLAERAAYEPAARFPYVRDFESKSSIQKMAFDPDGGTLTQFRVITSPKFFDQRDEGVLEVWDAGGYADVVHVPVRSPVLQLTFEAGGQFVAAITRRVDDNNKYLISRLVYRASNGAEVSNERWEKGRNEGGPSWLPDRDGSPYLTKNNGKLEVVEQSGSRKIPVPPSDALKEVERYSNSHGAKFLALYGPDNQDGKSIVVYRRHGDSYVEWQRLPNQPPELHPTMRLSADGRRLVVSYYNTKAKKELRVWDVGTGRYESPESVQRYLESVFFDVDEVRLSADGRFLVLHSVGFPTRLFDLSGGREPVQILDATEAADTTVVAFSPDSRYVGACSGKGVVRIFELNGSRGPIEVARLQNPGGIEALAISDDGKYVAAASSYAPLQQLGMGARNHLRIWLLQPQDLLPEAEARARSIRQRGQ